MTTSTPQQPVVVVPVPATDEFKDLGFGSEVARSARRRLLNRDGSFNVFRKGLNPLTSLSLFNWSLTTSWPKFLAFVAVSYLALNLLFAFAFVLCGPQALQSAVDGFDGRPFIRAFFFSIDTFGTIGHGNTVPVGVLPNILVATEALANILGIALATGVVFARLSRPTARIIYSRNAVVAPYRGGYGLEFRIANERSSQIIEAEVQAILTKMEKVDNLSVRRFHELPLERSRIVFFNLAWTVVHPIDEKSPLFGLNHQDLIDADAELLVLFVGIDDAFSQTVHSRSSYKADEIVWGARFANMFMRTEAEGIVGMDLNRIHEIEMVYTL